MAIENELINKTYYQTIIDENEMGHPIKILGDMYKHEMQKDRPDLSTIRYAQGEVYFLNHDYDAAIYKWDNFSDEKLIPWTRKNIADAHFEMGLLEHAEEFYKAVNTHSVELKTEVLLQLFSLYIKQGKTEKAVDAIKDAVHLNPDYSDVTEIAQTFFEEFQDWDNAVELAVNEAIRTKLLSWFAVLEGYAEQGLTSRFVPSYFNEALVTLLRTDIYQFENLSEVLWNSYQHSDLFLQWVEEINQILLENKVEESYMWKKLPSLFKNTYDELVSGRFLIRDFSNLLPSHLLNWLEISSVSDTLISSSAILAWNEIFPSNLEDPLVNEAAYRFEDTERYQNGRQEGIQLLESIKNWAEKEGVLDELMTL